MSLPFQNIRIRFYFTSFPVSTVAFREHCTLKKTTRPDYPSNFINTLPHYGPISMIDYIPGNQIIKTAILYRKFSHKADQKNNTISLCLRSGKRYTVVTSIQCDDGKSHRCKKDGMAAYSTPQVQKPLKFLLSAKNTLLTSLRAQASANYAFPLWSSSACPTPNRPLQCLYLSVFCSFFAGPQ